ncbi:hypothetical protein FDP41_010682 [Naegleria fowleri]|uniref:Tetratricopeptide repeat protein 30 n=1 Tax=Naegleria fowleri TaxID=5763 RepID=A0A6A5C2K4_NAEFO|nr:uncharacterized protein FDP41_010682 [Naegleria fowleri]KAF0983617.1 hypothetical protein FDP41_010682 [Naegleria fowleri]
MNRISTAAGGRLMTSLPTTGFWGPRPGTTLNGGRPSVRVQEGEYTKVIYTLIVEKKFEDAKQILQHQLEFFSESRAALSLLAYCDYMLQNYAESAQTYEKLVKLFPTVDQYKLYQAQSLYKAGMYPEAVKACATIESEVLAEKVQKLLAACQYELDDLATTKSHAEKCIQDDPDTLVLQGCILYKEEKYDEARKNFQDALNIVEYQPHIAYNIALCYYRMKQYTPALKYMQDIIERGIREHPELSVGSNTDGFEVRSVGNSQTLRNTALVEAFNLKFAIQYQMKNYEEASEALRDMPPRTEEELDPVTLHNQGLLQMETDPNAGFKKLKHLIQHPPFPPETFGNLLLLYCKHQHYLLAADILAENSHLSFSYLSQDIYDFLEALIMAQTSPEEAFRSFDDLATKHIDNLRKLTKQIQDARMKKDSEGMKKSLRDFDEALEAYIPVLMAMAKIYWDIENYPKVEQILLQSAEFCSEHDVWKLNMANTYFMQANKFNEAIKFYMSIVKKQKDNLLDIHAMVLANLCVSYIMVSQNEDAEEWMRKIENEEQRLHRQNPNKQSLHLCIVNLVIGTLYCSKGHYEFGISRVMKSLIPYNKKIMTDTWFYAKRCFLSLFETLAKNMIVIKDQTFTDILNFLDAAALFGKEIKTTLNPGAAGASDATNVNTSILDIDGKREDERTVTQEARLLKRMCLRLME